MARRGLVAAVLLLLLAGAFPPSDGDDGEYQHGIAGWSGPPDGEARTDGACGYGANVGKKGPFMNMMAGFGPHLDCGKCYRVICIGHEACSDDGVRVTITDSCRIASCEGGASLFDMTGHAFGSLAQLGRANELRAIGLVAVHYKPEDCYYSPIPPQTTFPAFRVDPRATKDDFAVVVVFIDGIASGNMLKLRLRHAGDATWRAMSWDPDSNTWHYLNEGSRARKPLPVTAPISIEVSMPWYAHTPTVEVVSAENVIPVGWQPGQTYYPIVPAAA